MRPTCFSICLCLGEKDQRRPSSWKSISARSSRISPLPAGVRKSCAGKKSFGKEKSGSKPRRGPLAHLHQLVRRLPHPPAYQPGVEMIPSTQKGRRNVSFTIGDWRGWPDAGRPSLHEVPTIQPPHPLTCRRRPELYGRPHETRPKI